MRGPAVRCRDGLPTVDNAAAARPDHGPGRGEFSIDVRSSATPAVLGRRRERGSSWGIRTEIERRVGLGQCHDEAIGFLRTFLGGRRLRQ